MKARVFALPPGEDWIVDRIVDEWNEHNGRCGLSECDVVWLAAGWCHSKVPRNVLMSKHVVTTVHHIVPDKFDMRAKCELDELASFTDVFHVPNFHTRDFVAKFVDPVKIKVIPYWANPKVWHLTGEKHELRLKYGLPKDKYIIGSFQRDTEGCDLKSPKLEKGPDLFVDFVGKVEHARIAATSGSSKGCIPGSGLKRTYTTNDTATIKPWIERVHVVLAGWRRQYVMESLSRIGVPYTYFELPKIEVVNELYQTLDLYPVTSRYEGGPQALIECGLLNVNCVSRPIGMADVVLPPESISDDVSLASPSIPQVSHLAIPERGFDDYRKMFDELVS